MGIDIRELENAGLDTKAGLAFTGSEDKYISAVGRFYRNYGRNSENIRQYRESADYENYMITVHALKSNAKMIGATTLSGSFETLEMAARDNDTKLIDDLTDTILSDYAALVEKLSFVGEMENTAAADEISADEAQETVNKILEALDDFDDELAKKLAVKLQGYPFRMTQAGRLKEAIANIDDFMYDEAADIIRDIAATIE